MVEKRSQKKQTMIIYVLYLQLNYLYVESLFINILVNKQYIKMYFGSPPRPLKRKPSLKKEEKAPIIKKKTNKSVENIKRRRKNSLLEIKKFQISPDRMGLLIQQQKLNDIRTLKKSVALQHYYETLMSLFMILYGSSQIITSNIFDCKQQTTGLSGLKFIGIIVSVYERIWNEQNLYKLRVMARNIMKMGKTPKIFEEKIQFVCRKTSLNHNMGKRIQMAFLNPKLSNFWDQIIERIKMKQQVQILDDLYELAPQKMAYWDFTYLVNQFLVKEQFYDTLKSLNKNRCLQFGQDANPLHHTFTYQFQLIEIFCFHEENYESERKINQKQCQLI